MRPSQDETITLEKPFENYTKTIDQTNNSKWFEIRWNRLTPYVKHTLGDRCFYRKKGLDDTLTLYEPDEGFHETKEEDGVNEKWFEDRWIILTPYVKHTLGDRCFYRKKGLDDTLTLYEPVEGFHRTKEEDKVNEEWFEWRWAKLKLNINL